MERLAGYWRDASLSKQELVEESRKRVEDIVPKGLVRMPYQPPMERSFSWRDGLLGVWRDSAYRFDPRD